MGMIDIVGLIRERLSLRPPKPVGELICTVAGTGPYKVFGDRAGLAELVDRILDYMVAHGGSPGNVEVRSDGTGSASSVAIKFAVDPPASGANVTKADRMLGDVWRAGRTQLVQTHGGRLEFTVEGYDTIRVRLPVRPTARIADH